jgi:hypothetical protein
MKSGDRVAMAGTSTSWATSCSRPGRPTRRSPEEVSVMAQSDATADVKQANRRNHLYDVTRAG